MSTKKRSQIRTQKKHQLTKKKKRDSQLKKKIIIGGTHEYTCNTETLGSGGFGTVLLCATKDKTDKVAVKLAKTEKSIKELQHEISIYSILGSENLHIVKQITDAHITFEGTKPIDATYLVLEYCNAGDLSKFVKTNQSYNITDILGQIFDGMNYLFDKNILHLDLKPGNILVNTEANGSHTFKITDFGLSKKLNVDGVDKPMMVDITTMTAGTPIYKPTFKNIDRSTYFRDLYAFYCIMYYLYYRQHYNVIPAKQKIGVIYETKSIALILSLGLVNMLSQKLYDLQNAVIKKNIVEIESIQKKGTVFTKRGKPNLNISGIDPLNISMSESNNEELSYDKINADPEFYTEYYTTITKILTKYKDTVINPLPEQKNKNNPETSSLAGNTELVGTETQPVS